MKNDRNQYVNILRVIYASRHWSFPLVLDMLEKSHASVHTIDAGFGERAEHFGQEPQFQIIHSRNLAFHFVLNAVGTQIAHNSYSVTDNIFAVSLLCTG